ncbi:MAG: galactose oxidase, partial [Opitutae bacterium]|nr:galactose oxidase [Opitutae bacterium]
MRASLHLFTLLLLCALRADAVPPTLNYAGQVAVNGQAFDGQGLFKFALVNAEGNASHWSNDGTSAEGSEPQDSVSVSVNGGLYSILLGNSAIPGMSALDPAIFQQEPNLRLRVGFNDGVNGFQQLSPDR